MNLLSYCEDTAEYEIECECSSGTYIRTLIADIGEKLGCGATMTSLRRTKANGISIDKCYTFTELESLKEQGNIESALMSVDSLVVYDKIKVTQAQAKRFSNGGGLDCGRFGGKKETGLYNVYDPEGEYLGVGEIDENKTELSVRRVYVK